MKTRNINKNEVDKNSLRTDKDNEYYNSQFVVSNFFIQICVRARPLNQKEIKYNNIETIRVIQNNTLAIIDNSDNKSDMNNKSKEKYFTFDYVFDTKASQVLIL